MDTSLPGCRELCEAGAAILAEAGIEDAKLDARLLMEHFCGIGTHRLLADPQMPVEGRAQEAFMAAVRLRAARRPLAYIIGKQDFMGLPFFVSPDVLIPEQDTENLAEEALRHLEDRSRILDLCTGSGCILLSLLRYSNGCIGVGTDLSAPALALAQKNAQALGLADKTVWLQGDLFEALQGPGGPDGQDLSGAKFDLIIANPPYIPSAVIETLEPEVRCAQPRMALDGGSDGLDFYRRIVAGASGHLVFGGRLMLEIGHDQGEAVRGLLQEAGYYGVEILQDYGGKDRVASGLRSAR